MVGTIIGNILSNPNNYYIETYPDGKTVIKHVSSYKHIGCGYILVKRNIEVFGINNTIGLLNRSSLSL